MNIESFIASVVLLCIGAYFAWRNGHKTRLASAAASFRAAIDPTAFSRFNGQIILSGHVLHAVLLQVYPAHLAAAREFRRYLGPIDRWRFSRAWNAYHGGNEETPDFLALYCVPENGEKLLVRRLEALRNAASQT